MSSRLGIAIAITIAFVFLSIVGLLVLRSAVDDGTAEPEEGTSVAAALAGARDAVAPFEGLTEAQLSLDGRCLRVAIADEDAERREGLRGVTDLDPYDGMLFVYANDIVARFTMADTLIPLDIGFYAADGSLVDRTTMVPCPEGNDASCPTYGSREEFRYALETGAGDGGDGPLGPCG